MRSFITGLMSDITALIKDAWIAHKERRAENAYFAGVDWAESALEDEGLSPEEVWSKIDTPNQYGDYDDDFDRGAVAAIKDYLQRNQTK